MGARAYKLRRSPWELSVNQVTTMELTMGRDFPHPSIVPGAVHKKGKGMYSSDVWLINAELYYNYLIEKGYRKVLEDNGVINAECLVGCFGAWK